MPLNKPQLKSAIKSAMNQAKGIEDQAQAIDVFAEALSSAIDTFVKTGTVAAGIPVATAGTASNQTGATTGPGTIS